MPCWLVYFLFCLLLHLISSMLFAVYGDWSIYINMSSVPIPIVAQSASLPKDLCIVWLNRLARKIVPSSSVANFSGMFCLWIDLMLTVYPSYKMLIGKDCCKPEVFSIMHICWVFLISYYLLNNCFNFILGYNTVISNLAIHIVPLFEDCFFNCPVVQLSDQK